MILLVYVQNPNLCVDPSLVHWLACNGEPSAVKYPERKPELGALIGKVIFEQVGKTFTSILIAQVPTNSISSNVAFIGTKECRLMKVCPSYYLTDYIIN